MAHWNEEHRVFGVEQFPQHVIYSFGAVSWPPRSPDLSNCDSFLWVYLKCRVYTNRPRTIEELKLSIPQGIAAVPQKMLELAKQDFDERLWLCVRKEGRHLIVIIFRTYFKNVLKYVLLCN